MSDEIKKRVDRFRLNVEDEFTKDSRLSIDIPTYFKIDESAIWKAVMREMTKQEKKANKESDK